MAAVATERIDGRTVKTNSASIKYNVETDGDALAASAIAAIAATAPSTFNGQVLDSVGVDPTDNKDFWTGEATYKPGEKKKKEPLETGSVDWSFDTQGATKHITNSRSTIVKKAPAGKTAPDFKNLIGATEGGVDGVDIKIPTFNFTQKFAIAAAAFTATYVKDLYELTGKTNDSAVTFDFNGNGVTFQPGEVLFNGAAGASRAEDVEISLSYSAIANETGLSVGEISEVDKKGFEYLWIHYEDIDDDASKKITKRPIAVYVEQVYEDGDFGKLEP